VVSNLVDRHFRVSRNGLILLWTGRLADKYFFVMVGKPLLLLSGKQFGSKHFIVFRDRLFLLNKVSRQAGGQTSTFL